MNDIHGEVGIDVERLRAADPDGLYLFMLEDLFLIAFIFRKSRDKSFGFHDDCFAS